MYVFRRVCALLWWWSLRLCVWRSWSWWLVLQIHLAESGAAVQIEIFQAERFRPGRALQRSGWTPRSRTPATNQIAHQPQRCCSRVASPREARAALAARWWTSRAVCIQLQGPVTRDSLCTHALTVTRTLCALSLAQLVTSLLEPTRLERVSGATGGPRLMDCI